MSSKKKIRATYRLQLHSKFGFAEAIESVDYLSCLGISHLYLSPFLQAVAGSTHGYDVVDHGLINLELGGQTLFDQLCQRLDEKGIGIILDIVPNHMAISGPENPWWWDVLENGPASQYSRYFDVDWHIESEHRSNLILLTVLGDHYGIILENGELQLQHENGKFTLHYYERVFPVAPRSIPIILELAYQKSGIKEIGYFANAMQSLPHANSRDVEKIQRRQRDKAVLDNLLAELCNSNQFANNMINDAVSEINADCDQLDKLIGRQNYKLACWKLSKYQVGYRRFFDINSMVGLRMEDEQAFDDSHSLVINLENTGKIDGFRVDHPDGLNDPTAYFARLRKACPEAMILAEKILEPGEILNPDWQISGTTGYDFLNLVNGLFIDKDGFNCLQQYWQEIYGENIDYDNLVYRKKKKVIHNLLSSEISRMVSDLTQICENHRRYRDFGSQQLFKALAEIAANFVVYRTYIQPETGQINEIDQNLIRSAIARARNKQPELGDYIFDFLAALLLLKLRGEKEDRFVRRFQQFTGPVMAKSIEDTVFYIYNPLSSANEVGGNPGQPFVSVKQFHYWCGYMAKNWPLTMLASSTHDTKRSEDVRARLNLLSEIPHKWFSAVKSWLKMNSKYKLDGSPDRNTEYLLYQTLVGTWPISRERIAKYIEKAVREAKVYSSWSDPNLEFEKCLLSYIDRIFADTDFINSLTKFVKSLVVPGYLNSLAQLTLKLTAPGFPDIYQGTKNWNNSLVDPDNRRPVDMQKNAALLNQLAGKNCREILYDLESGLPKVFIIKTILEMRRDFPVFDEPDSYNPVDVLGSGSDQTVAFMRGSEVMVIVPRCQLKFKNRGNGSRIIVPEGEWCDLFSRKIIKSGSRKIKDLLKDFPVAILIRNK